MRGADQSWLWPRAKRAHLARRPDHIRRRRLQVTQVSHLQKDAAARTYVCMYATGEPW